MLRHRHIDRLCIAVMALALALAALLMHGEALGLSPASAAPGYAARLFDRTRVHTVELLVDDWAGFLETAAGEAYTACTAVIDGEAFHHVGLRAKGNNSRRLTEQYGLDRYSLKLEFDHFTFGSYHGLDKFSLDSAFQDNSYMKNWLAYDMMAHMGVPVPLCSYAFVRVNGADWGLFLAIEEPEEAFARRVYGPGHGQLYKPDYRSLNAENADVHLRYAGDDPAAYDNIFRNAKFDVSAADQARLIRALRVLSAGEDLETAVNVDQVLRYFVVQVFVVNLDSYLGRTGHNYFLYEEDGRISMLPWDYNLAFATYSLGMPDPVNDAALYINYPIDTPAAGEIMFKRPLYHNLMQHDEYFARYHAYFDQFIATYFGSGYFSGFVARTRAMIAPYVERDPTAFCSYEDFLLGAETIERFCLLRAQSVRGQLEGDIPSTIRGQAEDTAARVGAGDVWLPDMGEIADLADGVR